MTDMTVIADDSGAISLGGIMGGESTGCTEATTEVVLEVALFDPKRTALTGRRLGIESDARDPLRARRRSGHGPAGHGVRDASDPRALWRRGERAGHCRQCAGSDARRFSSACSSSSGWQGSRCTVR